MFKHISLNRPAIRLRFVLLFAICLVVIAGVSLSLSPKANAFPQSCNNNVTVLCSYGGSEGFTDNPPDDINSFLNYSPPAGKTATGSSNDPYKLAVGSTVSLQLGYSSGDQATQQNVYTWIQIPDIGNHVQDANIHPSIIPYATTGDAETEENYCFDIVYPYGNPQTTQTSPYGDKDYQTSGGGGLSCDPGDPTPTCPTGNCALQPGGGSRVEQGGGHSVIWYQPAGAGTAGPHTYGLSFTDSTAGQLCFRVHVSLTPSTNSWVGGSTSWGGTPEELASDLPDVKGMGDGRNGDSGDICFSFSGQGTQPTQPTPLSGSCLSTTFNLDEDDRGYFAVSGNTGAVTVTGSGASRVVSPVPTTSGGNPPGYQYKIDRDTSGSQTVTFSYTAGAPNITISQDEQSSPSANSGTDLPGWPTTQTVPCYNATIAPGGACSIVIDGNVPGGPSNAIDANQPTFTAQVTVTNTGPYDLPASIDGDQLAVNQGDQNANTYGNTFGAFSVPTGYIYQGQSSPPVTLTLPTPAGGTSEQLWAHPAYSNLFAFGPGSACSATVNVYQPFNVSPGASVNPGAGSTNEDPKSIDAQTWVTNNTSPTVYIPTSSVLYEIPAGGSRVDIPPLVNGGTYNGNTKTVELNDINYQPSVINPGDQYCSEITLSYTAGYVGPGGSTDVIPTNGQTVYTSPSCITVTNDPYVQFFGSDVTAGSGFGNSCTSAPGTGNIYAYLDTSSASSPYPKGSGVQFGAEALGVVEGLGSASLTSPAGQYAKLTFANSSVSGFPNGSSPNVDYGGAYALSNDCVPDYYGTNTLTTLTQGGAPTIRAGTNGIQYYQPPAGSALTINGGTINSSVNQTIYVKGNVYITNNICYLTCGGDPNFGSVPTIPSLFIIASGNILIAPNVSQLDGAYIAQPNSASNTGIINTCAENSTTAYPVSVAVGNGDIFTNCNTQLTVNGAFVAGTILLDRSYGSLRYGQSGENPLTGSAHNCGTQAELDCAAEIFNFSPEMYMSQPAGLTSSGPSKETYDYFTSLPPVL